MIKNIILLVLTASLGGCFGRQPTVNTGFEGKPMPSFNILLSDSITRINTNDISSGSPIVFFLFSPECPYCQAQTEAILRGMPSMKNIRFYFLSNFSITFIRQYVYKYQLDKFPNIIVGQDSENYFINYYNVPGVPYLAIFNNDKLLKRSLIGNVGSNIVKDIAFR